VDDEVFTGTTSISPNAVRQTLATKFRNGIDTMSEKQIDRVQSVSMWIIGGLMTLIVLMGGGFIRYVVEKQNERIERQDERILALEEKYQVMLEANAEKIASIDKNLAIIAAKSNVELK
jgi:hypothetical protein